MVRGEQKVHGHAWAGLGKGAYVAEIVIKRELLGAAYQIRTALRTNTREAVARVLGGLYGWGSFMAGQVVDDWSWTPLLASATDHYTWAPQGPGSVRGHNRVMGYPLTQRIGDEEWQANLQAFRHAIITDLGEEFSDLTLMDVQNCLCEFDKYERARLGEGRPRALYHHETAY